MLKAVLFDLDGVLVDSETISTIASDKVLNEVGIFLSEEERKEVFGRRTIDNYRRHIERRDLNLNPDELVEKKNKVFKNLIKGQLKPLPGVTKLIDNLKEAGVFLAVVSSSPLERVEASLEETNLLWEFPIILSGDCCRKGKPHPEPFLLAAEKLGTDPSDCVVVEDAEAGVNAAKAAGMKCLAVDSPNTHGQDLSQADAHVKSLEEVSIEFLEDLFNE
jgi:HAD superfamily hydrolase (TIGR01509 family)